jgi:sortase A
VGVSDEQNGHNSQSGTKIEIRHRRPGVTIYHRFDMQPASGPLGEVADSPSDPRPPADPPEANHRRRPPLGPIRRTIREVGFGLITAGVIVLLFVGYQLWGTGFAERSSQNRLKKEFNTQIAAAPTVAPAPTTTTPGTTPVATPTTVPATPPTGEAVAHLEIPKIDVDKFVVDGTTVPQLRKGPGHYAGTPMPGEPGNAAIAGHRTTYGAPFYRLNELQAGDDIYVTTRAGRFHYVVDTSTVVKPSETAVLDPTTDNRLTLTTCNPRFSAATRLVVVSHLTQPPASPAPAPVASAPIASAAPDTPAAPIEATGLGTGDNRAWPPTILFGVVFLGLWVAVRIVGARARRRGWLAFLVGIPVCAVPLWFMFENVIRLLPANI